MAPASRSPCASQVFSGQRDDNIMSEFLDSGLTLGSQSDLAPTTSRTALNVAFVCPGALNDGIRRPLAHHGQP
jgi:hypothetical protein